MNGYVILLSDDKNEYLNYHYILGDFNYEIVNNIQYATLFRTEHNAINALQQVGDRLSNYTNYQILQVPCERRDFRGFNSDNRRNLYMITQKNGDDDVLWYQASGGGFQRNAHGIKKYSDPSYAKFIAYKLSLKYKNIIVEYVKEP